MAQGDDQRYAMVRYRFQQEYPTIYASDRALALWVRMLMAAGLAWPLPGTLPPGTRGDTLQMLVDAGLVHLLPGRQYVVKGMDKERAARTASAQRAARARWAKEAGDASV